MTGAASPLGQRRSHDASNDDAGSSKIGPVEDRTPDSARRLFSPASTGSFVGSTGNDQAPKDLEGGHTPSLYSMKDYFTWLHSPSQNHLLPKDQGSGHHDQSGEYASLQDHLCNSSKEFKQSMFSWPANAVLLLSFISTSLSCLFFLVAAIGPRYGDGVGTHGYLTASTAAFLTSALAKLIEVSFVTLVVAYLGQTLARRAYSSEPSDSVSFAEISMRHWAVQPG